MSVVTDAVKELTGRDPEEIRAYVIVVLKRAGIATLGTVIAIIGVVMIVSGNKNVAEAASVVTKVAKVAVTKKVS